MEKNSFILIDANSLVNRAFYAMSGMKTSRGEPIGAVYGFTTMLVKLAEQFRPRYIAAAFDVHAPTFRHRMTPIYKATRKPMPTDLAVQMQPLKDLLSAMGIKLFELEGYEADDIIGTLAARSNTSTYILTGDRDSLQLVTEKAHALLTKKGISEIVDVSPQDVPDIFGVNVDQVVDFKALAGDSSDNIPGVAGIGEKTAAELLSKYGTLDGVYEHLNEITGSRQTKLAANKDNAYLSQKLAKIDTNVPIEFDINDCVFEFPFRYAVREVFARYEFKSLLTRTELFAPPPADAPIFSEHAYQTVTLSSSDELKAVILTSSSQSLAFLLSDDGVHFAFDGNTDYFAPVTNTLLSPFTVDGCVTVLQKLLTGHVITFGLKDLLHKIAPVNIPNADDIALMGYLLEYRLSPVSAAELFTMRDDCMAELKQRGMTELYEGIELALLRVLFDMEREGFTVDRTTLDEIDAKFTELERLNIGRIRELSGNDTVNLKSPYQLAKLLFEDMCIPYPEKNAKTYSTKAEILQKLSGEYEIVDEILRYRFNSKLKSTFIDGLRKTLRPDCTVHTSFNQTVTTTGRLSSTDPNLQNIPTRTDEGKLLRSMFVPRKRNLLVDADYSQIELKLLAHFSGDPKLIEAFRTGQDIHTSTASEVFGVDIADVTPQMRRDAKAVNFGIVYGISNYGLSQNIHIAPKKADEYIKRYFDRFPAVKSYLDGLIESAKKLGYAVTMFGRRRAIPELNSSKFIERKFGERIAMNTPLQGSAADIIKIAMIKVNKRLDGMKSKLIMQVHDELIVDAATDEVDTVKDILRTEMEGAVELSVPLNVDIAVGKNWMECK